MALSDRCLLFYVYWFEETLGDAIAIAIAVAVVVVVDADVDVVRLCEVNESVVCRRSGCG
eukprot:gene10336-7795_t